ncbi:cupin domain-containing protein [Defluviimonas sp. D31]|uniref:cupin domain-containing protein n=1 Tax=Defluviimonas sp. D31 TaxID=3083253 RepID=UPI00296E4E1F|nr:cupin domain-containing protein [Defluviimonas sp. D31]MDW4550448.1 cupin domain-containing protein [Defluviimonas sp. D31]
MAVRTIQERWRIGIAPAVALTLFGALAGMAVARMSGPTEHKGLTIGKLGVIEEEMLRRQIGLEGYFMQLRAITIAPGGQIAEHSHEKRPGLVKVIDGEAIEGRASGETVFAGEGAEAIIEDGDTVHWFYNRTDAPATAIVCDLTPVS